jgi:hypothetical protein
MWPAAKTAATAMRTAAKTAATSLGLGREQMGKGEQARNIKHQGKGRGQGQDRAGQPEARF